MGALGFVFVTTEPGKEGLVLGAIRKYQKEGQYVRDVNPLLGEYDLVVEVEAKDYKKIGAFVVDELRSIPGVVSTKTMAAIDLETKLDKQNRK